MISEKRKNSLIFLLPTIVAMALVIALPLLYSFVVSFFSLNLKRSGLGDFVGLGNYISALRDSYYTGSLLRTVIFALIVVAVEFLIGFGIALLLNTNVKGKSVFFSIIIIPMMITPVAVGLCWRLLLHNTLGVVNWILGMIGLNHTWLADSATALGTVMFIDIWQQVSYMVLVLLAGLVSLPKEPYEAAAIDGASRWQTLKYLTVPMMLPTFGTCLLLRIITAFKTYDLIYVLTKGGPGVSTEVVSYNIYRTAFVNLDISKASAMSFILLIILIPLAYLTVKFMRNRSK